MGTLISILILIVCVLLIFVVLIQNSKEGGLVSGFSSSNQVMGVRKTADFLEKATWTLAITLLALSLFATPFNKTASSEEDVTESVTKKKAEGGNITAPPVAPQGMSAPATPAANGQGSSEDSSGGKR